MSIVVVLGYSIEKNLLRLASIASIEKYLLKLDNIASIVGLRRACKDGSLSGQRARDKLNREDNEQKSNRNKKLIERYIEEGRKKISNTCLRPTTEGERV